MKREIIEGQCFGAWKVLKYDGCYEQKKSYYICQCMNCGGIYRVRADKMKSGRSTQCAPCARKNHARKKHTPMLKK